MNELLTNKILSMLPASDFERLVPVLEPVSLAPEQTLSEQGEVSRYLYFPESSVISCHCAMQDGKMVEVGMIGKDGVAGLTSLLGSRPTTQSMRVAVAGSALRMRAEDIKREFDGGVAFRWALLSYAGDYNTQVSQRAACNVLHNVEKRFAVWLLLLGNRLGMDQFDFTQERIAQHLGVRRAGISVVAKEFHTKGIISYTRGQIRICNRHALEAAACECYEAISKAGESLSTNMPI